MNEQYELDFEQRTTRSVENRNAVYHDTPETVRSGMRAKIVDYMRTHGPSTREEVAIALGKQVHAISGRFTALLGAGVLEEQPTNDQRGQDTWPSCFG